jgi:aspartyl protease family protein
MGRFFWIIMAVIGGGLILLVANDGAGESFGVENDAFASALYLGVWGVVLAAGILASGQRFGDVARSLAIWLLIALVLVAGYQFRYELQDIASRLTAGLIPGSPISLTDAEGRTTVSIEKQGNGHFETRGSVNGAEIRFVIDTGATATVLSAGDAAAAGYRPDELAFNVPVSTANGRTMAARVVAEELRIGAITRNRMPMLVAPAGQLDQSLLGMSFLSTLAGYDVRGDRMMLIE